MLTHYQRRTRVNRARFFLGKIAKSEAEGKTDPRDAEVKFLEIAEYEAFITANPTAFHPSQAKLNPSQEIWLVLAREIPRRTKERGKPTMDDRLSEGPELRRPYGGLDHPQSETGDEGESTFPPLNQLKANDHKVRYGLRKAKIKVFLAEPDEILEEVDDTNKLLDDMINLNRNSHATANPKILLKEKDIDIGEHGSVSRHRSKNIQVQFSEKQRLAFQKLRNILASEDVILSYPDYKKAFDLTTDASAFGIGAVLSQEGRPTTMISRTLKDREPGSCEFGQRHHLVTFIESATVNETRYINHDMAQKRAPGVASSPSMNITLEHDVLSLPYLQRLG
ncbi:hypothetical protein KR038_002245 [Drosophila bunnanda]|nr:hypothetical protein KR038_002245 [Drosophila bunnanda]